MKKLLGLMAVSLLVASQAKAYEIKFENGTGYSIEAWHTGDNLHRDMLNAVPIKHGKNKVFRMLGQYKGAIGFRYTGEKKLPGRVGRRYFETTKGYGLKYSESKGLLRRTLRAGIGSRKDKNGFYIPTVVQTYPKRYLFGGRWPKIETKLKHTK